ncbi:MAG: tetratricopeptide repeat protein [Acidobacteriota bacterium]|nr:tetratricopeptide repeat protein [Acidobacteriota bacterium]
MPKPNNLDSEIQPLDENRQMRNLANAIRLADDFSLLFVRCNQRPRQREIIAELEKQLNGYRIKVILLERQTEHLLDELQARLGDEKYDAVFVYGLESSFPKADEAAESPFVVTLNHSRNSFKKVLNCPLVLFLPEYALSAIYHGATDFYSIRSGVYLFSARAEETERLISHHTSKGYLELERLLFEERANRINTIEKILAEYKSLPNSQRNFKKELTLKGKLADLYKISNELSRATELYKEVINYARKSEDVLFLATSLDRMAGVYVEQGKYREALELSTEAVEIDEKILGTNHAEYAVDLNNLATIYYMLGNYNEVEKLLNKSLEIFKKSVGITHPEYIQSLGNLAEIYHHQGKYDESVKLYEETMEVDRKNKDANYPAYARRIAGLSKVYYEQGKYQKALALANEAHKILRKTLGIRHPQTIDIKTGIEMSIARKKEQASLIVPYKK